MSFPEVDRSAALLNLIQGANWSLDERGSALLVAFQQEVALENRVQNLTRLVAPADFFTGHLVDCYQLLQAGVIQFPSLDFGSGVGVPGIPSAIMGPGDWVLAESEKRKADFLNRVIAQLGLKNVEVYAGRAEEYLKSRSVGSIVVRAVGPVSRVYEWVRRCSTWNNLVLLKGPAWEEEWANFSRSSRKGELKIARVSKYSVGELNKQRWIVELHRC